MIRRHGNYRLRFVVLPFQMSFGQMTADALYRLFVAPKNASKLGGIQGGGGNSDHAPPPPLKQSNASFSRCCWPIFLIKTQCFHGFTLAPSHTFLLDRHLLEITWNIYRPPYHLYQHVLISPPPGPPTGPHRSLAVLGVLGTGAVRISDQGHRTRQVAVLLTTWRSSAQLQLPPAGHRWQWRPRASCCMYFSMASAVGGK